MGLRASCSFQVFVPALHVGVPAGGCGGVLRVSFARALLPEASISPADVPVRPAEGAQLRVAGGGAAGRATVGLAWPGLTPASANKWLLLAWMLNGTVLFAACFILADLACVAPVADEDARWNTDTTRAFLLSLLFSLVAGDLLKVLALTFVSASLLPGFLSPRARVLRVLLRSISKVIDGLST